MNTFRFCIATGLVILGLTPGIAEERPNYLALAISDGPTAHQRILLVTRGSTAQDVVQQAYAGCYQRAVEGYAQTCKVGFGTDWVVGVVCVDSAKPNPKAVIDIEADSGSPEAARAKALKWIADGEKMSSALCQQVAEFDADGTRVARSIAKDPAKGKAN